MSEYIKSPVVSMMNEYATAVLLIYFNIGNNESSKQYDIVPIYDLLCCSFNKNNFFHHCIIGFVNML